MPLNIFAIILCMSLIKGVSQIGRQQINLLNCRHNIIIIPIQLDSKQIIQFVDKMSQGFSNPYQGYDDAKMANPYQGEYPNQNQQFNPAPSPSPYGQITNDQIMQEKLPVTQDIRQSFLDGGYAADVNQLKNNKNSKHVRSLISTIILFGGIVTFIALSYTYVIDVSPGALAGICAGFYVFYLMLSLICNPLFSYLSNMQHGINFEKAYQQTRAIKGYFSFNVTCYHYETRYHTRTVTDNNGNSRTETYTTQQKNLSPRDCVDESGHADQVRAATEIIFVHNIVNYRFRDEYSRGRFESQWHHFQNRHRFDVHQDYSQRFVIPGLKSRRCFYVGQKPTNYKCVLVVLSLFGLIWPYSMYVESKVSRYNIQYLKIVGF